MSLETDPTISARRTQAGRHAQRRRRSRVAAVVTPVALWLGACGGGGGFDGGIDATVRDMGADASTDDTAADGTDMDVRDGPQQPITIVGHREAMPQAMAQSVTLERPGEAMPDDLLLAIVAFDGYDPMDGMIVTPDRNWVLVRADSNAAIFQRRMTAMDPTTFAFRRPMDAGGAPAWGAIIALRGTRMMPIDDATSQFQPSDWCRPEIPIASGVEARSTGALLVYVAFARDSSSGCGDGGGTPNQGVIAPMAMTELLETMGQGGVLEVSTQLLINGGRTGTRVGRVDGPATRSYVSFLMALSPL